MEMTSTENSQPSTVLSNDVGHPSEDAEPQLLDHGDAEMKSEITEEELRGILEIIAATGKFWHDWDTLKGLLFFRLKQVLAEYPEAQTADDQQSASLGETYTELVRRLEEALFSFTEGPPFTLQRLCEILLAAHSLYPKLSKLALALEKNLLVTSTLTISTGPYPSTTLRKLDEPEKGNVEPVVHSSPLQNGVGSVVGDLDEEMADAEEIPLDDKDEEISVDDKDEEIAADNKGDEITTDDNKGDEIGADKMEGEEVAADNKDADKEIAEEPINGTSEASTDQNIKSETETSGESSPSREHIHSTS